ncbi:MAG: ABC transporter permease, partial [Chloroflexota bacterium]|nr:ABC transporter permease [Chloroflexota bacterium]
MIARFWPTYILRSFRRGGRRTGFAVLCVALGVGAVVALQLASLTIRTALTSDVRTSNGGDISLVTENASLSSADLAIFRRLQAEHRISAWTAVASTHATAVSTSRLLVPFEVDVVSVPPFPLGGQPAFINPKGAHVAALLRSPGDALITSVLADELGVSVGDRIPINGIGAPGLTVTISGILAESSFSHSAALTLTQPNAASVIQGAPQYGAIYANSSQATAVAHVLRQRFPTATIQTVPEALKQDEQQVHDFSQFNLLIGLLALAIAGIGILNAMQSLVSWRRLEIATLKALGFGQFSLYLLFGGEAVLIGLIGGAIGSVIGAVLGQILTTALARAAAVQVEFRLDPG